MGTTRDTIRGWLQRGLDEKATHVIVVCDTFDHGDYPIMVKPGEDVRKKFEEHDGQNMQRVMEVYDLSLSIDEQVNTKARVFNF